MRSFPHNGQRPASKDGNHRLGRYPLPEAMATTTRSLHTTIQSPSLLFHRRPLVSIRQPATRPICARPFEWQVDDGLWPRRRWRTGQSPRQGFLRASSQPVGEGLSQGRVGRAAVVAQIRGEVEANKTKVSRCWDRNIVSSRHTVMRRSGTLRAYCTIMLNFYGQRHA